jgi:hypothetical protein|tara:strand:- start:1113 stop:1469 length:357 start_codon:yes stop_codon:yes gene_type:complete
MTSNGASHRGMHYRAQRLSERLALVALSTSAIVAFACGWFASDYDLLKRIYFGGVCGTVAIVVPHWEWIYGSKDGMKWRASTGRLKAREGTPEPLAAETKKKPKRRAAQRKAGTKTVI